MPSKLFTRKYAYAIPPEKLANVQTAIQTLLTDFVPYLLDLNADERRTLPKASSSSFGFVTKAYSYMRANMQMKPGPVDMDEYGNDLDAYNAVGEIVRTLRHVFGMADDTQMFLGARSYGAGRACYKGFQAAAEMGEPGAELIVADLSRHFAGQGRTAKPSDPPPADDDKTDK